MPEINKFLDQVKLFLKKMIEIGGSDLYIKAGGYISARVKGDIERLSNVIVPKEVAIELSLPIGIIPNKVFFWKSP